MERGSGANRIRRQGKQGSAAGSPASDNSSAVSSMNLEGNTSAATAMQNTTGGAGNEDSTANRNNNNPMQQLPQVQLQQNHPTLCSMREQDQYMPIANVIRIMRRILPPHAKISDDAKETIQECVSEYISFITGEANDRCQREQRKTITAEDVIWAMGKLGFDDYVEPLTVFLNRYREMENERTSIRETVLKRGASDYGTIPLPPYLPNMPMGDHQGIIYDPTMQLGGYYRDPSGAGGSGSNIGSTTHNSMPNYDPYAQFK